jgi:hypothetical protein
VVVAHASTAIVNRRTIVSANMVPEGCECAALEPKLADTGNRDSDPDDQDDCV